MEGIHTNDGFMPWLDFTMLHNTTKKTASSSPIQDAAGTMIANQGEAIWGVTPDVETHAGCTSLYPVS